MLPSTPLAGFSCVGLNSARRKIRVEEQFQGRVILPPELLDNRSPIHYNHIPLISPCRWKSSPVLSVLAPAGLRSGPSMKLLFFPFCTSCCGLNLSQRSRTDRLSVRRLICSPHFLG